MSKRVKDKVVKRKAQKTRKPKKDNSSKTWKRWLFTLALISFFCAVVYVLFFSSLAQVNSIEINGAQRVEMEKIRDIVESEMSGSVLSYLNKNNYFIVSASKIRNKILEDKRIKEVKIKKMFPNTISVDVLEHSVVSIWCVGNIEKGNCFILEKGYVESPVNLNDDVVTSNDYFVIVDEAENDVSIGDRVMPEEHIEKIRFLGKELIYALNVGIEEPYIVASRGSHEVRFLTDEDWHIVVDPTHELEEILEIAKLFVTKVELPSRRNDLEYVDMRFSEKIFYKMKEGIEQVEENDPEAPADEGSEDNLDSDKE